MLANANSVAVIGLGRFGSALALELMASGTEVLGIDGDADIVQNHNGLLTHVVRADCTKEEVLRQLAVPEFDRVVVSIGSDLEASILTTSILLRIAGPKLWAKAASAAHVTILRQLGVEHVIYPEKDMGRRVAHLVRGSMQDYIEVDDSFALVKTTPPAEALGVPLCNSPLWSKRGVKVTAFRREGAGWECTTPDTVLQEGDTILIAGATKKVESFDPLG